MEALRPAEHPGRKRRALLGMTTLLFYFRRPLDSSVCAGQRR